MLFFENISFKQFSYSNIFPVKFLSIIILVDYYRQKFTFSVRSASDSDVTQMFTTIALTFTLFTIKRIYTFGSTITSNVSGKASFWYFLKQNKFWFKANSMCIQPYKFTGDLLNILNMFINVQCSISRAVFHNLFFQYPDSFFVSVRRMGNCTLCQK